MNYKKGFTLIELLVVIAVISLLSSVVLAAVNSARDKARLSAILQNGNTIRNEAELYRINNGNYNPYDGDHFFDLDCYQDEDRSPIFNNETITQAMTQLALYADKSDTNFMHCGANSNSYFIAIDIGKYSSSYSSYCITQDSAKLSVIAIDEMDNLNPSCDPS